MPPSAASLNQRVASTKFIVGMIVQLSVAAFGVTALAGALAQGVGILAGEARKKRALFHPGSRIASEPVRRAPSTR